MEMLKSIYLFYERWNNLCFILGSVLLTVIIIAKKNVVMIKNRDYIDVTNESCGWYKFVSIN